MRTARITRRVLTGIALGVALTMAMALPALGATPDGVDKGLVVEYDGKLMDLAFTWGDAQACLIWQDRGITKCFASEAEMDRFVAGVEGRGLAGTPEYSLETAGPATGERALLRCTSYLRLYDGTSYTGAALYMRDRRIWQNLSNFGFGNRTSSYKVGACSTYFADYNNGAGAWYPTYLSAAYNQWPSMTGSWNNDVSSIYIR